MAYTEKFQRLTDTTRAVNARSVNGGLDADNALDSARWFERSR